MTRHAIPRLVVGGVSSGVGKTTATLSLIAALRARGLDVAAFKCGPDYLDPTYHRVAAGRPCHNIDGWMMGRDAVLDTFIRGSAGADIAIIEGVMGLFDGASPTSDAGSTAEIAKWLDAPVLLVADAGGMARSIAALATGFARFDPDVTVAGVLCNRVGSRGHLDLLQRALAAPPVVGGLPKSPAHAFPERHLGLRTADPAETSAQIEAWGAHAAEWIDLDRVLDLASAAPALPPAAPAPSRASARCRIGIAWDEAFHFYYLHNLAQLEACGAELVRFSPVRDAHLPAVDGLILGGGYPELFARELAANQTMRDDVRAFAEAGRPIYAECGGLMYLTRAIETDGGRHDMVGVVPADAIATGARQALGYVEAETTTDTILGPAGSRFRGHEFRYSFLRDVDDRATRAFRVRKRRGGDPDTVGFAIDNVVASYMHAHWASNPRMPALLVDACAGDLGQNHP